MGLFRKRSADPDELAGLRAEIVAMSARLDAADHATSELGDPSSTDSQEPPQQLVVRSDHDLLTARVQQLTEQLEAAIEAGEEAEAESKVEPGQVNALRSRVDALTERLDAPVGPPPTEPPPAMVDPARIDQIQDQIQRITDRMIELDERITSISTELANQIAEMSGEMEALGAHGQPADEIVSDLRDVQTRLANEQVRYQIAFRQDLADLAERLRRA